MPAQEVAPCIAGAFAAFGLIKMSMHITGIAVMRYSGQQCTMAGACRFYSGEDRT